MANRIDTEVQIAGGSPVGLTQGIDLAHRGIDVTLAAVGAAGEPPSVRCNHVGLRRFGELYGYLFAVFAAGSALGSYLMGVAFDAFHSYAPALAGFVVALIIASLLISHLDGYVFPVQGADTGSLSRGLAT